MSGVTNFLEDMKETITDLVNSIGEALESFARDFWDGVTAAWRKIWKEILEPILQPIFKLLGIEDLTIVSSAVVTQPIFDEAEFPQLMSIVRKSILLEESTAESIYDHITTGPHIKLTGYFRSASTDYFRGLPTVLGTALTPNEPAVEAIIAALEGEAVILRTFVLESISDTFYVEYYIWVEYNYRSTQRLLTYKGADYRVETNTAKYNPSTDNWDLRITPIVPDSNGDFNTITLAVPYFPITNYGYQVRYNLVSDSTGDLSYYFYELLKPEFLDPPDNTEPNPEFEPTLEAIYTGPNNNPDFVGNGVLPIVPVKEGGVYLDNKYGEASNEYQSSKRLLRKLSINLATVLTVLRDDSDPEANPTQIVDAFVGQGININSTTRAGEAYVFEFFLMLYYSSNISSDGAVSAYDQEGTEYTLFNSFRIDEGNYNKIMTFQSIEMEHVYPEDSNAYDGKVTREYSMIQGTPARDCGDSNYNCPCREWKDSPVWDGEPECVDRDDGYSPSRSILVITKKINRRHAVKLTITNLTAFSIIKHPAAPTEASMAMLNVIPPGEGDNTELVAFLVPIIYPIVKGLSIYDQGDIILESTHLILYAADIQYIEWYKTPKFFKFLGIALIVARIALAVVTAGGSEASGIGTILYELVVSYIILQATRYIVQRIIERDPDSEIAQALGIFVAVAGLYIAGSVDATALTDQILLAITATSMATDIYIDVQMDNLAADYELLEDLEDEINRRDEEYAYLFEKPEGLAYYDKRTNVTTIETVDMFFYRTLNFEPGNEVLDLDRYFALGLNLNKIN